MIAAVVCHLEGIIGLKVRHTLSSSSIIIWHSWIEIHWGYEGQSEPRCGSLGSIQFNDAEYKIGKDIQWRIQPKVLRSTSYLTHETFFDIDKSGRSRNDPRSFHFVRWWHHPERLSIQKGVRPWKSWNCIAENRERNLRLVTLSNTPRYDLFSQILSISWKFSFIIESQNLVAHHALIFTVNVQIMKHRVRQLYWFL